MTKLEKEYQDWIDANFLRIHSDAPLPFMGPKYFTYFVNEANEEFPHLNVELFRVILVEVMIDLYENLMYKKGREK